MQLGKDFMAIFDMKAKQDSVENKMVRAVSTEGTATAVGLFGLGYSMVTNSFFV
jgi:hypothetical protein